MMNEDWIFSDEIIEEEIQINVKVRKRTIHHNC